VYWARSSAWIEQQPSKLTVVGSKYLFIMEIPPGPQQIQVVIMKDAKKFDEVLVQIKQQVDLLLNDNSVPRNVKSALEEAKNELDKNDSYAVKASTATYKIDEVSNDINLPPYARTIVWNILSLLESIKE